MGDASVGQEQAPSARSAISCGSSLQGSDCDRTRHQRGAVVLHYHRNPVRDLSFRLAGLAPAALGKDIGKPGQEPVGVTVVVTAQLLVVVPLRMRSLKDAWVPAPVGDDRPAHLAGRSSPLACQTLNNAPDTDVVLPGVHQVASRRRGEDWLRVMGVRLDPVRDSCCRWPPGRGGATPPACGMGQRSSASMSG